MSHRIAVFGRDVRIGLFRSTSAQSQNTRRPHFCLGRLMSFVEGVSFAQGSDVRRPKMIVRSALRFPSLDSDQTSVALQRCSASRRFFGDGAGRLSGSALPGGLLSGLLHDSRDADRALHGDCGIVCETRNVAIASGRVWRAGRWLCDPVHCARSLSRPCRGWRLSSPIVLIPGRNRCDAWRGATLASKRHLPSSSVRRNVRARRLRTEIDAACAPVIAQMKANGYEPGGTQ